MHYTNTIFNQLLNFLPKDQFKQFVGQHQADRYVKKLTTWNQLTALLYAQATGKDSLREIETGLNVHQATWHHLGIQSVAKSSLSYANTHRPYQIYEQLFYALLQQCKTITPQPQFTFTNPLYSFDSSIVALCLSMFDWATYSKTKGALKLHLLLNNRTTIPEVLTITTGQASDVATIKTMNLHLEPGSILVFDRGYIDYSWWNTLNTQEVYFVSRIKKSQNIRVLGQHNLCLEKNILKDEQVMFGDYNACFYKYPQPLRQVTYYDETTKQAYVYLTNNFTLPATQIALIYKQRWQIELFFKWIKQNLKIKTFLGTSKNAVLTQIWVAMIYYLLLAYIKFQTKFKKPLLELTRMIKETLLLRRNLIDLLSLTTHTVHKLIQLESPQLSFW
ncbi:MAG: transposase IS4 family protein [uncultured bacterium]|nr:MAG: transposase IS4 family protein [uncultured bacterium]